MSAPRTLSAAELDAYARAEGLTLKPLVRAIPRECLQISAWRSWLTLARCLAVIAGLGCATHWLTLHGDWRLAAELPALFALWFLQGCALAGLYVLAHDCGHYAFSRRRWVNDLLGNLIMGSLLGCYQHWKLVHNQHHVWSNVRVKDVGWPSDLKTRGELINSSPEERKNYTLAYGGPVGLLLGSWTSKARTWGLIDDPIPQLNLTARDARSLQRSVRVTAVCSTLLIASVFALGGLVAFFTLYLVPVVIGATLGMVFVLLQHSSEDALVFDAEDHTPFRSQVVGTYDTRFPRLIEWLCLDVNIHLVHHLTPRVPWYHLRRATAAVKAQFPECVQERRFRWSLFRELWAKPALERRPEGYFVHVEAPAEPRPERRPLKLPEGLLGSRA